MLYSKHCGIGHSRMKLIQHLTNYCLQRSWGKLIFSEACVKNFLHMGVCPIVCWDTLPPDQRQAPPEADTPLDERPQRPDITPSPHGQTPGTRHPSWDQTPIPPEADTLDAVHAGKYASYWYEILFQLIFIRYNNVHFVCYGKTRLNI